MVRGKAEGQAATKFMCKTGLQDEGQDSSEARQIEGDNGADEIEKGRKRSAILK